MLTCYLTRRKIGAWIDGALEAPDARATEAHVHGCARCRAEAESLGRLKGLLRQTRPVAEPDWTGFWPAIVRGIQDTRDAAAVPVRRTRWQPRWAFGGAIAAALVLSLGLWQLMPGLRESEAGVVITAAHTDDPRGTIMAYSTPERDVAVVWVLGLQD